MAYTPLVLYSIKDEKKAQQITALCKKLGVHTKEIQTKDADEKVDFDTGTKIEEPVESAGTKVEDSVFHIAEYIPKALRDLMYPNLVSEEELMEAVYQRGFLPKGTPFQNLPQEFVDGCLIGAWPQVLDVIKTMRSHYDIPFDK